MVQQQDKFILLGRKINLVFGTRFTIFIAFLILWGYVDMAQLSNNSLTRFIPMLLGFGLAGSLINYVSEIQTDFQRWKFNREDKKRKARADKVMRS